MIAVDQRGHGRSGGREPIRSWWQFAEDALALIEQLGLSSITGVGHSMGGQVITRAALQRPEVFQSLVLVDPVLPEPHVYDFNRYGDIAPDQHPIAQRRNRWASWEEMRDAFAGRSPYKLWLPRILDDYCRHGVLPAPDGDGFVLACPPVAEASVYMQSRHSRILERLHELTLPVTILRAKYTPLEATGHVDFTQSATWAGLAPLFGNARDVYLPELTHFIPMQAPEVVAGYVAEACRGAC